MPYSSSIRIVQISDLHNRMFGHNHERLLEAIHKSHPDVIVLTGDLIDRKTRLLNPIYRMIRQLTNAYEHVYFVTGNHEWEHFAYETFLNGLKERGVRVLDGKYVQLTKDGVTINVVGAGYELESMDDVGHLDTPSMHSMYTIVLAHMPDGLRIADCLKADLMLCGHTHGGQIRFPLIGAMVAPGQGLFPKQAKGVFPLEHDRFMYIDSGLGTTHLPIRFMNQSQFSVIDIHGDRLD